MVKEKNPKRVDAGKNSASKNRWIKEVMKTMKKNKTSFRESMQSCSVERKNRKVEPIKVVRKTEKSIKTETKKSLKDE